MRVPNRACAGDSCTHWIVFHQIVIGLLITCNVMTVAVVICVLLIGLVAVAVQALASDDRVNLIVLRATGCVRCPVVQVAEYFRNDLAFRFLFIDAELLCNDFCILLFHCVFVGVQRPVRANTTPRHARRCRYRFSPDATGTCKPVFPDSRRHPQFLPRHGFWPEGASLPEDALRPSQLHRITKQLRLGGFD
ncbi:hypothetical protein [Paraburkholderia fungorum]|uniref:hypothetical protein n=1 Tax=Paraburkholderia fungorum TaxID=134537 RepID=UPI0020982C21|nr:hypothetical protein [Paraburkholderia fungorum]USX08166.1 hypothetical protein NHH62_37055 [Paraburkholderia fungorum]